LYNLGIYILKVLLKVLAPFNPKIKKGVLGRAETFSILKKSLSSNDYTLWFHCSSLGEYEQGLPVFKELRKDYPNHKIVLSFFSPSGFEIRKNSEIADVVVYIPLDTIKNAKAFLSLVHPELVVFVKYDIWPNLLDQIKTRSIRAILISARFSKNQTYFKFYGNRLRKALFAFEHIFVQDSKSINLLNSINYQNATISGDTRYDRVFDQLRQNNQLDFIAAFKHDALCVVIGSSWPEDEEILVDYINTNASKNIKFIIAPHEIKKHEIEGIRSKLDKEVALFSNQDFDMESNKSVLIIDAIGYLSRIYSYADIAYVGGAMGKTGLHNILEPAVFGIPVIIGKNYNRFPEAKMMIEQAGVTSVKNKKELNTVFQTLVENQEYRENEGHLNKEYIVKNKGAVVQIMSYLRR